METGGAGVGGVCSGVEIASVTPCPCGCERVTSSNVTQRLPVCGSESGASTEENSKPSATPGGGPSGQVSNKAEGSGGTFTLHLLLCVTFCCDAGTSIVFCVTAEEMLPVFCNSYVPTKCLTRVELTCPMVIPLLPCMLITWTLVVEDRI